MRYGPRDDSPVVTTWPLNPVGHQVHQNFRMPLVISQLEDPLFLDDVPNKQLHACVCIEYIYIHNIYIYTLYIHTYIYIYIYYIFYIYYIRRISMDFIPKNLDDVLIHFEDFSTKRYGADSCGILRSPWGRVRFR